MTYKGKKKSNVYGSSAGYDLYASLYDESLGFLGSFEKDEILKMFQDLKGKKVLDLGCGTGRLIRDIRNYGGTVVAADISEEMLKIVEKKYPDVEMVCADAKNLPFNEGEFDVVVASFLIVHLKTLEQVFAEVYRVLKDGGIFIVTNINQRKAPKLKLGGREKIVITSYYHRPQDVVKALEGAFFEIEKEKFVEEGGVRINQIVKARK